MPRILLLILITFFNSIISGFSEVRNNPKIFRFCEETKKIVKFKYCGIETPLNLENIKRKITLDINSEDILPGDGIKYFKIEQDGESEVLKIIANKEDPILLLNNLNINSYYYNTLIIEVKILSYQRKQVLGRLFWKSNLDSKYYTKNSTSFNIKVLNDYQKIKIDLSNRNYLGLINNLVIHPLFDIIHRYNLKNNIDIESYGIEAINESQTLCNKQLEDEIVIYVKSIEFILCERNLFKLVKEVNFEGHDFNTLYLPPLSQITYNLEVPENNPVLLFSVFTPEWSYGVDINIFIENEKKKNLYNFKQRGFQYKECSKLIEVDMSQYAGKKINLTFGISSLSNQDRVFLKNPLIIEKRKKEIPNIILVLSDALRADHLSCYGYHRSTSPNLDKLARNGVIFTNNISQAPATTASHASLFTGKLPLDVGIKEFPNNSGKLEEHALTLAEMLKDEGYLTFGLYTNPYLRKKEGFSQGFDDYFYYCHGLEKTGYGGVKNSSKIATEEAINLITKFKDFPFFLFLYYIDPHSPYDPPEKANIFLNPANYKEPFYYPRQADFEKFTGEEYRKLTAQDYKILIDLYDGEIFNLDNHIGNFLDMLKRLKLFKDAIIFFTSDHGEALGERGGLLGHGKKHYYEQCHVPLLISYPSKIKRGKKYNKIIGNIDIVPTVLTLIGKNYTKQDFSGLPLFTDRGILNHYNGRHIHVETSNLRGIHSVYNDDYLLIYNTQRNDGMLFKYKEDKENTDNLKEEKAEIYHNLFKKISEKLEKRSN